MMNRVEISEEMMMQVVGGSYIMNQYDESSFSSIFSEGKINEAESGEIAADTGKPKKKILKYVH